MVSPCATTTAVPPSQLQAGPAGWRGATGCEVGTEPVYSCRGAAGAAGGGGGLYEAMPAPPPAVGAEGGGGGSAELSTRPVGAPCGCWRIEPVASFEACGRDA